MYPSILVIINRWLSTHEELLGKSRQEIPAQRLYDWLAEEYPSIPEELRALYIDGMIAAGIGRPWEQHHTVYCRLSY